jgi:hypothetical protein
MYKDIINKNTVVSHGENYHKILNIEASYKTIS